MDCLRAGHRSGDEWPSSAQVYRRKLAELDELIGQLQGVRGWIAAQLAVDRHEPAVPRCEFTAALGPLELRGHHRAATSDKGDTP